MNSDPVTKTFNTPASYLCNMSKMKKNGGLVYSTHPQEQEETEEQEGQELPAGRQKLLISRSSKGRGGKVVTLVTGFEGSDEALEKLGKMLKNKCGTGGSVKDGEILIQGDVREKVAGILTKEGYKVRASG
jgi:translation initiation factor 1